MMSLHLLALLSSGSNSFSGRLSHVVAKGTTDNFGVIIFQKRKDVSFPIATLRVLKRVPSGLSVKTLNWSLKSGVWSSLTEQAWVRNWAGP